MEYWTPLYEQIEISCVLEIMKTRLKQASLLIIISLVIGLVVNNISGWGIPIIGSWPSLSGSATVVVPPSAEEGDPPFISLDEAAAKYQTPGVIFIDAREPEDYEHGHITGALSLPYDYLEDYWDNVLTDKAIQQEFVIYCSGSECESSLFLGREMAFKGFKRISIFYGGWREWEKAGLPVENAE